MTQKTEVKPLELAAFVYGQSRSGKTAYVTPVLLLEADDDHEHRLVNSFLFWPCADYPHGMINPPHRAHRTRVLPADVLRHGGHTRDGAAIRSMTMAGAGQELDAIEALCARGVVPPCSLEVLV